MPTCHVCGQEFPYGPQGIVAHSRHVDEHYGVNNQSEKDAMFQTGEPMDLAMRLLKMPVVDTKVPGLKVAHGFDEPVRELHNYNPSAGYGKKWQAGPELIGATNFQTDEMEEMTPNEYFDRLAEVGINTFTGQKKFPVPHEKTLLGQSQKIQDQLK